MNTPVSFTLARLLKDKLFVNPTLSYYFEDGEFRENVLHDTNGYYGDEYTVEYDELLDNWNSKWVTKKNGERCFGCNSTGYFETLSAPTIVDVVMWLYEIKGIWIYTKRGFGWEVVVEESGSNILYKDGTYNSVKEAYEAGITYVLNLPW